MRTIIESFTRPDVERMQAAVSRLAGGAADAADDVTIDLFIAGGCPGQRLEFRATIPAQNAAEVSYEDERRSVSERFSAEVRAEELTVLAQHLDVGTLMELAPNADERYVPDSITCSIAMTAGNARITLLFAVDAVDPPADEEVAMRIQPGQVPFVLRASEAPPSVRPALEQLATVVNRLVADRR
ncbi:hypothetical protein [Actinomadura sp. 6N118]|uniref:hypothetical protein n=1 Tax=Actinomadura sp. 6N118 TaxID=3375151 RepID=UPI0037A531AD